MKIGTTQDLLPWQDTFTSDLPLVFPPFARFTEVRNEFKNGQFFKNLLQLKINFISVRRNNGSAPSHWSAGSGTIARKALQTLEQLKLVEKDPNGGRRLSSQGRRDLDRIAAQVNSVSVK